MKKSFKIGTGFCLLCFYQELGFEPVNYESRATLQNCLKQLEKVNPNCYKLPSMCVLCECQKYNINFTDIDLTSLSVDMKALKPKMIEALAEASDVISREMN